MVIKTLFGSRRDSSFPELLVAWDEYSIDENPDGFEEEMHIAKASDMEQFREIDLLVSDQTLKSLFRISAIAAVVQ